MRAELRSPTDQPVEIPAQFRGVGVSIIMPAYNEEANAEEAIRHAVAVAEWLGLDYEVIFVDDGSTDRTGAIARAAAERNARVRVVTHNINRGYGAALRTGFEAAAKPLVFFTDADLQFELRELPKLLALSDGYDVVMGYRLQRGDGPVRSFKGGAWNALIRLRFGYLGRDIDCAFKLVKRRVLAACPLHSTGALINAELLVKAKARGFRFAEVGVRHRPRQHGVNTGASLRVMMRALAELIQFSREPDEVRTGPSAPMRGAGGGLGRLANNQRNSADDQQHADPLPR